jgi:DNA-binding NtrC family response regulator
MLATDLLDRVTADVGRRGLELTAQAIDALRRYPWPGNIRELRNVLERAVLLSAGDRIRPEDLRFEASSAAPSSSVAPPPSDETDLTLQEVERRHIERVLRDEHGHVGRAAARLGLPRSSLYQKVGKLGLNVPKG